MDKIKMVKGPNHDEEPASACNVCHKVFRERHMMIHTGEKPFTCPYCAKAFSLEYNLNTHIRVHTGEKPYKCEFQGCGKCFTQSGNLKTHMKTNHSGLEPEAEVGVLENEEVKQRVISFESIIGRALSEFGKTLDF